jgi:hypothetical protein
MEYKSWQKKAEKQYTEYMQRKIKIKKGTIKFK